jgi:hypothetical protein
MSLLAALDSAIEETEYRLNQESSDWQEQDGLAGSRYAVAEDKASDAETPSPPPASNRYILYQEWFSLIQV